MNELIENKLERARWDMDVAIENYIQEKIQQVKEEVQEDG